MQEQVIPVCWKVSWQGRTGLGEQGAFIGTQEKKREFMSFGRQSRELRKNTRMLLSHIERKL